MERALIVDDKMAEAILARLTAIEEKIKVPVAEHDVLTAEEACEYLKLKNVTSLRQMAKRGEVPGFKVGYAWRFRVSDLDEWIRRGGTERCDADEE